jgi:hypothetical protein
MLDRTASPLVPELHLVAVWIGGKHVRLAGHELAGALHRAAGDAHRRDGGLHVERPLQPETEMHHAS